MYFVLGQNPVCWGGYLLGSADNLALSPVNVPF